VKYGIYKVGGRGMSVQLIPMKSKERKRFSPQQKIHIIRGWERIGNGVEIAAKYQIDTFAHVISLEQSFFV
jgi:hypothetical protein